MFHIQNLDTGFQSKFVSIHYLLNDKWVHFTHRKLRKTLLTLKEGEFLIAKHESGDISITPVDIFELSTCDLNLFSLDELCQINAYLMAKISDAFHEGDNQLAGYITLVSKKYMNEIKNNILFSAI